MAGAAAPVSTAPVSTPGAPSAAVVALNAQRAANVASGKSAYTGTAASLSSFTTANPTTSTAGGSGGGPEAGFNSNNTVQAPYTPAASPAIVTSNQSRSNYANNVTDLNSALNKTNPGGVSIVDYLNKSGMPSDFSSRSVLAENNGIQGYTGTAQQNLQLLGILQNGGDANNNGNNNGPSKGGTDTPTTPVTSGGSAGTTGAATTTGTPATTPAGTGTTTANTDGSTTNADGTTTNADGSTTDPNDPTSGLPPALASEYKGILSEQENAITTAQNNLAAAQATLTDDPAALAAAASISASYGTLIEAMNLKNTQVLGKAQSGEAAFGGLGVMPTTFMSDEMDLASARIADLVTKEQSALLKSNTAYQNSDVKAFNDAQTALNTATTAKKETLNTLLTATQKQVTEVQAQQKIDAAATKAQLASDVTTSAKIAASMAQSIAQSGITDPTEIASYVQAMATKEGITDPNILQSALVTAQAANTKANLTNAHTAAETNKTNSTGGGSTTKVKGGTDGNYTYTPADLTTYSTLLDTGGTINGTKYNGRGTTDGFVDPGAYTAVYNDWVNENKGTPKGFLAKYPIKNVNPSSYGELPAAIQPKAAPTTGSYAV